MLNMSGTIVIDLRMNENLCSGMTLRKTAEKRNTSHKLPSTRTLIHLSIFTTSFMIGFICTSYVAIATAHSIAV